MNYIAMYRYQLLLNVLYENNFFLGLCHYLKYYMYLCPRIVLEL